MSTSRDSPLAEQREEMYLRPCGPGIRPQAYWLREWSARHFQALSLQKLGRNSEAEAFFGAMEALCLTNELTLTAKEALMNMAERGRFAPENEKEPNVAAQLTMATQAEE